MTIALVSVVARDGVEPPTSRFSFKVHLIGVRTTVPGILFAVVAS